jgi:hypothetical protein
MYLMNCQYKQVVMAHINILFNYDMKRVHCDNDHDLVKKGDYRITANTRIYPTTNRIYMSSM